MPVFLKIPIGDYAERAVDWLTANFSGFFRGIKVGLEGIIDGIDWFLMLMPGGCQERGLRFFQVLAYCS